MVLKNGISFISKQHLRILSCCALDPEIEKIWEDKNDFVGVKLKIENNLQLEGITALRTKAKGYFISTGEEEGIGKTISVLVPQQRRSDFMMNVAVLKFNHVSHFPFRTAQI